MKWPNKRAIIYIRTCGFIDSSDISQWIFKRIFPKTGTRCWKRDSIVCNISFKKSTLKDPVDLHLRMNTKHISSHEGFDHFVRLKTIISRIESINDLVQTLEVNKILHWLPQD